VNSETLSEIKTQFAQMRAAVIEQFKKLSSRERALVWGALVIILAFFGYVIYEPVQAAFSEQTKRLQDAERTLDNVALALGRYIKLKTRQQSIENLYKEVEISEGVRSLIASLIESKAGIPAGQYEIVDSQPREFGAGYQQTPFRVRFSITDYSRLVSFLN